LDIVLILGFLLMTAFYEGSETAYTSFDRILLEVWVRRKRMTAGLVKFLSEHPTRFLSTTLVGANLANVAYSTVFAAFAAQLELTPISIILIAPFLILICGEILPKAIMYGWANGAVRPVAVPLAASFVLFWPIYLLMHLTNRILTGKEHKHGASAVTRRFYSAEELQLMLLEAHKMGMVSPEEETFLSRFFVLRDRKVREVMTPRTQVVAVAKDEEPAKALRKFIESGHTKLPVFDEDLDHINGYISARDFLCGTDKLEKVLHPIEVVPETKSVRELLEEFRHDRRHIAVVVDEHGGTDGIVTLEDILEELLGPVEDEFDKGGPICRPVGTHRFLASGRAELDVVTEVTGIEFSEGEYTTLGGFVVTMLGRIPEAGDELIEQEWRYRILKADARRVIAVLIAPAAAGETDRSPTA
jgi:CBS domain containing-hemolysin-like protein